MKALIVPCLLAAATLDVCAQSADWQSLRELQPNQRITIRTVDGKSIDGLFRSWSLTAIEILDKETVRTLRLADTDRVIAKRKGSRWKSALIGAAVGFGLAFPIGAAKAGYFADQNNPSLGTRAGIGGGFGLIGGGIGAAIGALGGGTKHTTIYRAAERQKPDR
jgi:hypothetical protein